MFKPRVRIPRVRIAQPQPLLMQRRSLHTVPPSEFSSARGVPGLLSPDGFHLAYNDYMQLLVDKLNALVGGTEMEQKPPYQILQQTAREPSFAPTFNYASMLHNNSFFFEGLNSTPNEKPMSPRLQKQLEDSFGSIETLQREMLITASSMFGPGFVWLVKNGKTSNYRVLATYLAGSPYSTAHWRRQGLDMNTVEGPSSTEKTGAAEEYISRQQLGHGASNGTRWKTTAPGGIEVIPVLCVSTWEHMYLRDYGVAGKRQFLENWWNTIDWTKVSDRAQLENKYFM
ncbi:superoxide dismutase [Apiospora hydei]|uniref:Superoxide dismutase n=1 Tax=Apiospora hydei TaxID=1337664 RepID=A0ABR1X0F3_9PEZI